MGNGPKKVSPKLLLSICMAAWADSLGIFLHPGGQRTGNKGYQKHDAKGHRIAGVIGPQGKTRDCKQKLKASTLITEARKLYIQLLVIIDIISTPRMYTAIIFASGILSPEKRSPTSVAAIRIPAARPPSLIMLCVLRENGFIS